MARSADSLADWFVGGTGKRKLLGALVAAPHGAEYTQRQLADLAGLHQKGSVVRHLEVLERAGLLSRVSPGGAYRVEDWSQREALAEWLAELEEAERRSPRWRDPLPASRGG